MRAATSFSLVLLSAWASAADYGRLERDISAADAATAARIVLARRPELVSDEDLLRSADRLSKATPGNREREASAFKTLLSLRVKMEGPGESRASSIARSIKSSPLYRDAGVLESSNWLKRAGERIGKMWPSWEMPKGTPGATRGLSTAANWIMPLIWGLLGLGIAFFLYWALRNFAWKRRVRRRARAVLEEDEPDRTVDEWLANADELALQGRHREAVRALYLACLLRFDEANVARFIRGQTNWEHLRRIQASPRFPATLDFVTPTRAFDRVWYGHFVRGQEDVDAFRLWYSGVTQALAGTI